MFIMDDINKGKMYVMIEVLWCLMNYVNRFLS